MLVKFSSKIVKKSSFLGAEWTYMLTKRIVAGNDSAFSFVRIKYGNHATDTVTGVIIYPDDFSFADAGAPMLQFGAYPVVEIEKADWKAFEAWGCVFLPASRFYTYGTDGTISINEGAIMAFSYATAIATSAQYSALTSFDVLNPTNNMQGRFHRCYGYPVRLVQDYK